MKKFFFSVMTALLAVTTGFAQQTSFPFTLGIEDGLPSQVTNTWDACHLWMSPTYSFAEPVSSIRLTVFHTSMYDDSNIADAGSRGWIFFTMGEFYLNDGEGNAINTASCTFTSNATELSEGSLEALGDGDVNTFFHSTWGSVEKNPVGGEHYIEVTFPEPLTSFAFGFHARTNTASQGIVRNFPNYIIVTEGGVEADPWPEVEFTLSEEATTDIQEGSFYTFANVGGAYDGSYYVGTYNAPGSEEYVSVDVQSQGNMHCLRLRETPRADCLFEAVDVLDGSFRLKNYFGEYIKNESGRITSTPNKNEAALLSIDDEGNLVNDLGYYLYMDKGSLFASDAPVHPMEFLEAEFSGTAALEILNATLAVSDSLYTQYKDVLADVDEGETAELEEAIAKAKACNEETSYAEIQSIKQELEAATVAFMKNNLYAYINKIEEILETASFGSEFGEYPYGQQTVLQNLEEQIGIDAEEMEFKTLEDVTKYLESIERALQAFYDSANKTATLPLIIDQNDGLPAQGAPEWEVYKQWMSPSYMFEKPISSIRITVTHTSPEDGFNEANNGSRGWVFFSLGEFYLNDENGDPINTQDCYITTNAQETSEGPIENLTDGDFATYFHTTWDGCPNNPVGGEHYIEIEFPEPLSCFSFGFHARYNPNRIAIANFPSQIIVSEGGVTPDVLPEYGFQMGEKVTKVEPNNLYVIGDGGLTYGEEECFLSAAGIYNPTYTTNCTYHRVRQGKAQADCVFYAEDAGDGQFRLRNLTGRYINNSTGRISQKTAQSSGAVFHYTEDGYLINAAGNGYCLSNIASLQSIAEGYNPVQFYKATVKGEYLLKFTAIPVDNAIQALTACKNSVEDETKIAALTAAIAAATDTLALTTTEAVLTAIKNLDEATKNLLTGMVAQYDTKISEALANATFGNTIGTYPVSSKTSIETFQAKLRQFMAESGNKSVADYQSIAAEAQKVLKAFLSSKIVGYTPWPYTESKNSGEYLGYEKDGRVYYESPLFVLEKPIKKFYMTNVHEKDNSRMGDGFDFMCLVDFKVFDGDGNEVALTASSFASNAVEPLEGSLAGLCDKDEEGNSDLSTIFHSIWSYADHSTGEHWLSVELPTELSTFSFQYISRNVSCIPRDIYVGNEPYSSIHEDVLSLADYEGRYTWTANNLYDESTPWTFEATLERKNEYSNDVILSLFDGLEPITGSFNGAAHTISFASGQSLGSDGGYNYVFATSTGAEARFNIDPETGEIKYCGQVGIKLIDATTGKDTGEWLKLSINYALLTPFADGIRPVYGEPSVTYYNLSGQRVDEPTNGFFIIRSVAGDGSVSVRKVLVK